MGEHDDKVFLKRFGGIIAGLVIVTILIIIISVGSDRTEPGANPSRQALAAERVAPVGGVRTELPAAEPTPVETAPEPAADQAVGEEAVAAAADTGIDGAAIYTGACSACHATGAAGAPVPGSEAWAERVAQGAEALVANAIAGVGPIMQPKGGRADLSDEEVRAAVEHMLAQ